MMRSRGTTSRGQPRPSSYQLGARHLLYHNQWPWRDIPLPQIRSQVRQRLPSALHYAWTQVNSSAAAQLPD
eukprot:4577359-Prorocentrum_lima.AAC.1